MPSAEDCEWGAWLLVNFDYPSSGSSSGRGRTNMGRPRERDGDLGRERGNQDNPTPEENNDMEIVHGRTR